ncbi:DUF732 domain-containing protein [Nocardia sp. NPDC055321]
MRTLPTLIAIGATAAALTAAAPTAFAAPDTGSGSGSGSSGSGCAARTSADRQFLRDAGQTKKSCTVQDSAIRLALSQCRWLDTNGNSARNHITLAESSRGAVQYPYTFLNAAIDAYCPQYQI